MPALRPALLIRLPLLLPMTVGFLSLAAGPSAGAQEESSFGLEVQSHTLDNGLRLYVLRRPGAPIVSFVIEYRVGSVNEREGETGIVHLLEHMKFKGTTTVGTRDYDAERRWMDRMDRVHDSLLGELDGETPDTVRIRLLEARIEALEEEASQWIVSNEFDEILARSGARNLNAITTVETTSYFVELPSNRAELWFILEADRMRNPVFREFYAERRVVAEERRQRLESSPAGRLYEAYFAAAFQVHPYGRPVIGRMADLERLSREQVERYHREFYGPNNAVVAVVGDVDPDQIVRWAEEYFGPLPPGRLPERVDVMEPPQREERRVRVAFDAEPLIRIGWKVPPAGHPDRPALSMLSALLTGGRSARLYHRLVVQDRIASSVSSNLEPGQLYPGLFSIESAPISPHTPEEIEAAVYEEIARLAREPPEEIELQRVRNQLEASEVRRLRSNFGLALQIAESATLFGDWATSFEFLRQMRNVSREEIQEVVRRYFRTERRTVAVLERPGRKPEEAR